MQLRSEINAIAADIQKMDEDTDSGPASRTFASIRDVEEVLYHRANIEPRQPRKQSDIEKAVVEETFDGKDSKEIVLATAG